MSSPYTTVQIQVWLTCQGSSLETWHSETSAWSQPGRTQSLTCVNRKKNPSQMTVSWLDTLSWKPVSKTASLHPFSCSADEWQGHRTHYQPHCIQNKLHGHCCLSFWSHCAVTQCRRVHGAHHAQEVLTSVRKRKKILSLERTGCDATRSRKFSRPTLRRSTKSGSRLSADSLCHTNSACKSPS